MKLISPLAGAASVVGAATTLPTTAGAHGTSAVPLAHRRKVVLDSSHRTSASTVTRGSHPLEPLSAGEIKQAFALIEGDARFPSGAVFPIVELKEPPKQEVLAWSPGRSFRREASANVYDPNRNALFEVVADLRTKRIASWIAQPGREPAIYADEYDIADGIVRADTRWQHAMHIRGIDPDDVYLDGWGPGALPICRGEARCAPVAPAVVLPRPVAQPV